jgi:simple sugar transport system ATP-binding protein
VLDRPEKAIENGIGYVPEDRITEGLFLPRSIGDNTIIAEIDNLSGHLGFLGGKTRLDEGRRLVQKLSIATPDPENACSTLSGGNQQRVVLAKWLAANRKALILNGPTVGVDIGSKRDIHEILHKLAHEGLGIIIISDDIPEILANSSQILIMRNGRISASLKPGETNAAELFSYMM